MKKIIKSKITTERLMQIRVNRLKRDMERTMRQQGETGWQWKEYGKLANT